MNRRERVDTLRQIKIAMHNIIKTTFEAIDEEIKNEAVTQDYKKVVSAPKLRLNIRNIKKEVLDKINKMGAGYLNEQ